MSSPSFDKNAPTDSDNCTKDPFKKGGIFGAYFLPFILRFKTHLEIFWHHCFKLFQIENVLH